MSIGYSNIAKSHLLVAIDTDDTQLVIDGYEGFSRIDADYTYAVLINASQKEIVKVDLSSSGVHTRLIAGGTTSYSGGLTVARGQGGTSSASWPRGSLIYIEIPADFLNEIVQKGQFRTVDYNPNGVLSPSYKGEKVYESTNGTRWWKSYDGTNPYWALICGVLVAGEGWDDPMGWGWDVLFPPRTWTFSEVATEDLYANYWNTKIAADSNGKAHVVCYENGSITYYTNSSGSWVSTAIDADGYFYGQTIIVDAADKVHLVCEYDTGDTYVPDFPPVASTIYNWKYYTNLSGSWVSETPTGSQLGTAAGVARIRTYTDGSLTTIFSFAHQDTPEGAETHKYIQKNGAWGGGVDFSYSVDSCDFDLDSSRNIHTCYSDSADLKYTKRVDGEWVDEVVVDDSNFITRPTLNVDSNDNVHIVYSQNYSVYYATNATGSWVVTTIFQSILRTFPIPDDQLAQPRSVVDSDGNVHVVGYGLKDTGAEEGLFYLTNSSGSWVTTLVYSNSEIGEQDIAIGSNDDLYVVFNTESLGTALQYGVFSRI